MLAAVLVILAMTASPLMAVERRTFSGETSAEGMTFDLIVLRPVGLAATVIGTAVFIVSLPFSAMGGNTNEAAEKLISEPAKYTFSRPLGKNDYQ
ncbi:MAG: hypothetical protein JRJ12_17730 [Deltaproteobacteria bacterium]|nr:hypothetical protein [Deltaproteobacteria bacterium]